MDSKKLKSKQIVAITVPARFIGKDRTEIVKRSLVYDPGPFAPKPKVQSGISGLTKK